VSAAPQEVRDSVWRELQPGERLIDADREAYRIVRFLAEGGYSQVYEAEHEASSERVAIKVLHLRHARNKKTLRRQIQEANTLYELQHPNVVRVHAVGARQADGMLFMVMDLLVGRTLRELVWDLGGKMPIPWALEIMASVARGLSAIHQLVIVHRDLKPENIHVRDDGHVSLFDLGTARIPKGARLTTRGYTIGTLDYMSPEQLLDPDSIDARSDLFAFGAILYELLSGKSPFAGTGEDAADKQAIGLRITVRPHPPLATLSEAQHVPPYVAAIVERLLEKRPADRYKSAEVVADLLSRAQAKFEHDLAEKHLAPLPLSRLGEIPRRPPHKGEDELFGEPSQSGSTNPFVSISLPPDAAGDPEKRLQHLRGVARSLAYASTEKMPIGAFAPPAPSPAAPRPFARTTTSREESRVTMLPFVMGRGAPDEGEESEAAILDDEIIDDDIVDDASVDDASVDDASVDDASVDDASEAGASGPVRTAQASSALGADSQRWGFESVAKLDRPAEPRSPGSAESRMFDPERGQFLDASSLDPSFRQLPTDGDRARPTEQIRVRRRVRVFDVLVVAVSAAAIALFLVVILSIAGVVRVGPFASLHRPPVPPAPSAEPSR
jgi:serine/threonine protein kinase